MKSKKRKNINELQKNQLARAIRKGHSIYEVDLEGVGVIFTTCETPSTTREFTHLNEYTIQIEEEDVSSDKKDWVNQKMRKYTTFMRESNEIVYARIRFRVFSEVDQRVINKNISFELGNWDTLYGTKQDPKPATAISVNKLGSKEDNEDGFMLPSDRMLFGYREDSFIVFNGKEIY